MNSGNGEGKGAPDFSGLGGGPRRGHKLFFAHFFPLFFGSGPVFVKFAAPGVGGGGWRFCFAVFPQGRLRSWGKPGTFIEKRPRASTQGGVDWFLFKLGWS